LFNPYIIFITKVCIFVSFFFSVGVILNDLFEVHYSFCVNNFLKNKITSSEQKYVILNKILDEYNIPILFGEDADYFERIDKWIYS
jgi:hypothetical protein